MKPYQLHHGDCLEVLATMADNSVDAVVTDPPYGLSQHKQTDIVKALTAWINGEEYTHNKKGFMGKTWDSFVPGPEMWREVYRVLKPGGHALVFASTRTQDLMAISLRLAGFEYRDTIMWTYECLDEQTEVATIDGVKPYHKTMVGDLVLCYDIETGGYKYQPILEIVEYEYSDTAYRLVGDFGEQVVSRNHRCIVERGGREVFQFAETLQQQACIPFLEDLSILQQAFCNEPQISEFNVVQDECGPQKVRAWQGHKTSVVRIVPFHYTGKVWCLRVPTGAFVAVRDGVAFPTGNSGFPKNLDVSKQLDRIAGTEREVVGVDAVRYARLKNQISGSVSTGEQWEHGRRDVHITAPATPEALQWQGWGTALKPSFESVIVARKPLEGTVAANVLKYGTGAINIDGCRVEHNGRRSPNAGDGTVHRTTVNTYGKATSGDTFDVNQHRWPANLIHDGSDEVIELFPNSGKGNGGKPYNYKGKEYNNKDTSMFNGDKPNAPSNFNDSGSAARYFKACPDDDLEDREIRRLFYCAKANKRDRNEGLDTEATMNDQPRSNTHPTTKPTDLMRYLCRLVTPPGGIVLDPFMGSGSTGKAAMLEDFQFIGIEREDEYVKIAQARIEYAIATKESQDTLTEPITSDPRQLSIDDI